MLKNSNKYYMMQDARVEFEQKEILFNMMRENKSYEKHPTHQLLYDALMQSLILDEYEMEKAKAAETLTQKKRRHDDKDQEPPAGPYQEMMKKKKSKDAKPSKRPKSTVSSKGTTQSQPKSTGKSVQAEETVIETADTDMNLNQGDNIGNTDEQPNVKDASKYDWFKKPLRPPTPNPEWNKGKSVDNELISKLTKAYLVGPFYNLLKGICKSYVELEYNIEECYRALSDQLDWNNPEGEVCPYDLNIPIPLHESRGHLTVLADSFFNNNLEYLKKGSTKRKYTTSKAAKYKLEGIKDMVPKLWSPIKVVEY
ncbi:hypothetical protein Tco_1431953 [Tanacetum coccineum]